MIIIYKIVIYESFVNPEHCNIPQSYWEVFRPRLLLLLKDQDTERVSGALHSPQGLLSAAAGDAPQFPAPELRGLPITALFGMLLATAKIATIDQLGKEMLPKV